MKFANIIKIRVFSEQYEDADKIKKGLNYLCGFSDLEEEKLKIKETNTKGFDEKTIKILELELIKDKYCNKFIKRLSELLSAEDKKKLIEQENRLDENFNFFIRLDKEKMQEQKFLLTETGNCYHITINISAYPRKKENAYNMIKELFK